VTRETDLASAFVEIAESMVTGRDLVDFLHLLCCRAVELLGVDAAGVMLADEDGVLRAVAASSEQTHTLELFALQHEEGVCLDVFRSGRSDQTSTAGTIDRWPHFSKDAVSRGYGWVCGLPLRHGAETLGAMNLFRERDQPLGEEDLRLGQALTDVVTVALLQRRETTQARKHARQMQAALDSRVLVEQAKGMLAERLNVSPDEAFQLLRRHARNTNQKLHAVCSEIVNGGAVALGQFSVS
jgi:GAF domain-containing protein